jgi:hypothetical protein
MNLTSETSKPSNIIPFESQELSADSLNDADDNTINSLSAMDGHDHPLKN